MVFAVVDSMEDALARSFPFWGTLGKADQREIAAHSRVMAFEDGVFVQGAKRGCAGVLFVLSGGLRAFLLSESGREITLFRLGAGECCVLAAACIMPMVSVEITINAKGPAEVLMVDSTCFANVAARNVELEAFMYRQSTERLSDVLRVMQHALFADANTRLATFLLEEMEREGTCELRITHEEIARHVGTAREVVTRSLKQLAAGGVVRMSRGVIVIVDPSSLGRAD